MPDTAQAMQTYAQLAVISHIKRQPLARDRFVLLCGAAACRAGWLEVAAWCWSWHAATQPGHQLARFPSFPDALRDADFPRVVAHWERWCPPERAEHLLAPLTPLPRLDDPEVTAGTQTLAWLETMRT